MQVGMEPNDLKLDYFATGGHKEGFATYRLGRVDNEDRKFPSDEALKTIFAERSPNGFEVANRGVNHCILFIQTGTSKTVRLQFLITVSNYPQALI